MKLLECKDKLTINELLQIALEYGNDNADMPADSESITESFNEWVKGNEDLFKKLILPHVSVCVEPVCGATLTPHRCPVCGGNGIVAKGFYIQTSGEWSTTDATPEACRSCQGTGIVWG